MDDPTIWHRVHFAFTIIYHYLFPQLTMGLAPLLVIWTWLSHQPGKERYGRLLRFWSKIFGINFAVGVVTGIPMEFQFGTNWGPFTHYSGGVIGQPLALEGMVAFFLESAFIGALIWGEKRLGPRMHMLSAVGVALGSWLSAYFILLANAFMQHPVGYGTNGDGTLFLADMLVFIGNPWAVVLFLHNMSAAVVTGSVVVCAVGAFYALRGQHLEHARLCLQWGTLVGLMATLAVAYPTGDLQAKIVGHYQPIALAAMEGRFDSGPDAPITVIGQPNVPEERLDNPIRIPSALSFLVTGTFHGSVEGLKHFQRDLWPDNIELLFFSFHIMVGLGTIMIGLMLLANVLRWRGVLLRSRPMLWALMLMLPFPYLATTAGWMTTELGRQPWLVYGLYHTAQGASRSVNSGDVIFTLLGWIGIDFVLGVMFLGLIGREILRGPDSPSTSASDPQRLETAHG